ncbi:MAG: hypothetical protein HYY04_04875 [Chloroflexi bacterium]|nr:hypothetical protein [Chloroflexota bacterium]
MSEPAAIARALALREKGVKVGLQEFRGICSDLLTFLRRFEVIASTSRSYPNFYFFRASGREPTRPINSRLFLIDHTQFNSRFDELLSVLELCRTQRGFSPWARSRFEGFLELSGIESVLYTIAQSIGAAMDIELGTNFARKNAGTLFEKLMTGLFAQLEISTGSATLVIPVPLTEEEQAQAAEMAAEAGVVDDDVQVSGRHLFYRQQVDMMISPYEQVPLRRDSLDDREILVSFKTTSKDRFEKIFVDRYILSRLMRRETKTIAIFLHDVQRSGHSGVSATFVAHRFLITSYLFGVLSGVYYVDVPQRATSGRWSEQIFPISRLVLSDLWDLIR